MPVTNPTAPIAVDYSVAPVAVRRVPTSGALADAAALTAALLDAQYGDWIVLDHTKTYADNFVLKVPTGTLAGTGGDNWVTIITDNYASLYGDGIRTDIADISNMPTLVSVNSSPVLTISANGVHHYRFVGIYFTTPQVYQYSTAVLIAPFTDYTVSGNYPHHISFERCVMSPDYDFGVAKGFAVHGTDIQWKDCFIDECKQIGQGDGNAIFGYTGKGPYRLSNNYVAGMGEIVFFGSSQDGGIPITVGYQYEGPKNISNIGNYFYRKLSWKPDHASYVPPCDTVAGTTLTTVGAAGTISGAGHSFSTKHTTAQVTAASTTIDIGADPLANGFLNPANGAAWAWISGTNPFHYTGTNSTGFTGVTGLTQTHASGAWVAPTAISVCINSSNEKRKVINCADATHVTLASAFSSDVSGVAWRYPSGLLANKGMYELKTGQFCLWDGNRFENGWSYGQTVGGLQLTAREFGWLSDHWMKNNHFKNCSGIGMGAADPSSGAGFGPSPFSNQRVLFENNLLEDHNSVESQSLATNPIGIVLGFNTGPYGAIVTQYGSGADPDGTLAINTATVGTGRTVTATNVYPFASWMVGHQIWYGVGRATITALAGSTVNGSYYNALTVDVTTAFPDTSQHLAELWFVGHATYLGTRYAACDSIQLKHNTIVGACDFTFPTCLQDHSGAGTSTDPVIPLTNFIFTDNIIFHGNRPNNGGGFGGTLNGSFTYGTETLSSTYLTSPTITKNVWFGEQTNTGAGFKNLYDDVGGGNTSAASNDFLEPSYVSNTFGGDIGFTNYAGGDYSLTSGSQFHNWANGGASDPGVNWTTLQTALLNTVTGGRSGSSGPVDPGTLTLVKTRRA